jgi:transposase
MESEFRIAGIDVHKKMLAVVVLPMSQDSVERRKFGTKRSELRHLKAWLTAQGVREVVMESTAQYWRPVWLALEGEWRLHLAQAQSNRAPRGRKNDFLDAERLVKRLLAGELVLSYVPEREQRDWRTLTRTKYQLVRERIRLQSQVESLLEEMQVKLSSVISDLFGVSGRRILQALAEGETDPDKLVDLGHYRLRSSREDLRDALDGQPSQLQRAVLQIHLEHLQALESNIAELDGMACEALRDHREAVVRLTEIPGIGVNAAIQLIAELDDHSVNN